MGRGKKAEKQATSGGGWGTDDNFWGEPAAIPDLPPASAAPPPPQYLPAAPPIVKRPLLEHLQPLFLYVCEQHRLAREHKGNSISSKAAVEEINRIKGEIEKAARYDPVLRQHYDKLKEPINWYLDSTFGSRVNGFPFRENWVRLAEFGDDGKLSGDDAFFDELQKELASDPSDESASERLAFYYTAIGLGFTGRYFKSTEDHRRELRDLMQRLYPRVAKYVDSDASGKITPESYITDKRDFITPSRDKPLIYFTAVLLLFSSLLFGYIYWYLKESEPLRQLILTND